MVYEYTTGARYAADINQLKPDIATKVALLDPNRYPLYAILSNAGKDPISGYGPHLKKQSCYNAKFSWFESRFQPEWDAINNGAGYAAGILDIVVDNGAYFNVNDIVLVPRTGERMLVVSIATNTLTVERGVSGSTAAAIVNDDPLFIVGPAFAEGSTQAVTVGVKDVEIYNYCQIVKTAVKVTNTLDASESWTENDLVEQERKKAIEDAVKWEKILWFGKRYFDTTKVIRYTGGIIDKIVTNVASAYGTTLSETEFNSFLSDYVFAHGSTTKYLFCSSPVLSAINTFARNKLESVPETKTWGIAIKEYISPFGKLYLVREPLFTGTIYSGYAAALDMNTLSLKVLRNTKYERDIQAKGSDTKENQYITEMGLKLEMEEHSALLSGVTGGYSS